MAVHVLITQERFLDRLYPKKVSSIGYKRGKGDPRVPPVTRNILFGDLGIRSRFQDFVAVAGLILETIASIVTRELDVV